MIEKEKMISIPLMPKVTIVNWPEYNPQSVSDDVDQKIELLIKKIAEEIHCHLCLNQESISELVVASLVGDQKNGWPPIMSCPSDNLKRCLGHVEMNNQTLRNKLVSLGYDRGVKFVSTQDLVSRVKQKENNKSKVSHKRYTPKSDLTKNFL